MAGDDVRTVAIPTARAHEPRGQDFPVRGRRRPISMGGRAPLDMYEHVKSTMRAGPEALQALGAALDEWYQGVFPLHLYRSSIK